MNDQTLLIRADASVERGTGHVMRMIALAQAWNRRGGVAHLLTDSLPDGLAKRLTAEPIEVHPLGPANSKLVFRQGSVEDVSLTGDYLNRLGSLWVVADGYDFVIEYQRALRKGGHRVAVVTDFDYCSSWACDMIVNQNPHAASESYKAELPECQRLLGTRYALLRDEFIHLPNRTTGSKTESSKQILLSLGGSDAPNLTAAVLEALEVAGGEPLSIRVLVGAANPHRQVLERLARRSRHRVETLVNVRDMSNQYLWADGVISAGGSSCWEWIYFGLNAAVMVIAENQRPIYEALVAAEIAVGLGEGREGLDVKALERWATSLTSCDGRERRFRNWVDGYGADRLAAALDSGVWLRRAEPEDRQMYFEWANDPAVRQNSLQSEEIDWGEHCRWFDRQLEADDRELFVAIRQERPVGQIRWTRTESGEWSVAFSVAAEARGGGLGREIVRLGAARMRAAGHQHFVATVKLDNPASARCFERLGWRRSEDVEAGLVFFRSSK